MIKRALSVLIVTLLVAPSAVFAQATKVGVITTLEGNVSARRVALPDPVTLKFKDDVFLQDTVTTGDKSLARMLLGGKAVVTVRERSVLTITEVPGRSTIDLQSGKFALAVAREKMRPGEEIQIRTPNAVAGVRGTVVITEVERQGAQVGTGVPAVVTNFFVLRGEITAQLLDANRNPFGAPFQIGTMQSFSAAGLATPRVQPVLAEQIARITSGLQPTGPKAGGDAGKEQVKTQAVQGAVALLSALSGGTPPGTAITAISTYTPTASPQTAPINALNNTSVDKITQLIESASQLQLFGGVLSGSVTITGQGLTLDQVLVSTLTSAVITANNLTLTQTGTGVSLVNLTSSADVTLAGPLAVATNSSLSTTGKLAEIDGKLTSTTTSGLFALDPTTITAAQGLVVMNGGSVTLAGPVLTDTNGTILTAGAFLAMSNGATLTGSSAAPLVQLNGTAVGAVSGVTMSNATMKLAGPLATATNVTSPDPALAVAALSNVGVNVASFVDGPLFAIENKSSLTSTGTSPLIQLASTKIDNDENIIRVATGSSVNLAGSLLKSTDAPLIAGNVNRSFISVTDGSSITTAGTTDPLLQLIGTVSGKSSVTAARNFFTISFNTTTSSPSMTLSGPFISATNTSFTTGDPTQNTFVFLFIGDSAKVQSTSALPFMTFTNSSVDSAGSPIVIRRSVSSANPSTLTLAGPLLVATNSTFNTTSAGFGTTFGTSGTNCCDLLAILQGAKLVSTGTGALLQLSGSTVIGNDAQSGFSLLTLQDFVPGFPASELVAPATMALAGPLLSATNSTITELFNLVFVKRSSLTSSTTAPLISLSGGTLSLGGISSFTGTALGRLLEVFSSDTAGTIAASPASVTLSGPLLSMTNGAVLNTNRDVLGVFNGAAFTSTSTNPLISLSTATINETLSGASGTGALVNVGGLGGPAGTSVATMTLSGPLLAVAGTINYAERLVQIFSGGALTSSTTSALISLSGGTTSVGSSSVIGRLMSLSSSNTSGTAAAAASVTLAGPLLSMSGGAVLNTNHDVLGVFNGATFAGTTTSPLMSLTSATINETVSGLGGSGALLSVGGVGGPTGTSAATLNLSGPLLSTAGTINYQERLVLVFTGGTLNSTTTSPLISLSGGTVSVGSATVPGQLLNVSGAGSVNLAGPLLNMTGGAVLNTNRDVLGVFGGAFTSTTTNPLISLTSATINETVSGFVGSGALLNVGAGIVNLSGPLLSTAGTINYQENLVLVFTGGTLNSTTTSPLISLSGGTVTLGTTNVGSFLMSVPSSNPGADAKVTLAGPLLSMTGGAVLNTTQNVLGVFNGGTFTSTTTSPLITLSNATINQAPTTAAGGAILGVNGLGGPTGTTRATVNLNGPLLSVASTLNFQGRIVDANNGGQVLVNDSALASPFVSINGGTHSIATLASTAGMFGLFGQSTNVALDTDPLITVLGSITIGTDQPLQRSGSGAYFQLANGATANTRTALVVDTALLAASAPLLTVSSNSTLTTASDAINLNNRAKLTTLVGPLAKIDAATLNISGNAVRVNNSALVTGDLFSISNGGKLNITGGGALFLSGNSLVNIGGFLVNFGGIGNTVSISNGLCPCFTTSSGINIALQAGATSAQVSGGFGSAVNNLTGNTFSVGATDAVVVINGSTAKVKVP